MPEKIVIWENEEWELLSFEEVTRVKNEDILIYDPQHHSDCHVSYCTHFDHSSSELQYDSTGGSGCYLLPGMWERGSWFLPYRKRGPIDTTKCRCGGPSSNRFCFDTQRVEVVCCRCKKRKAG